MHEQARINANKNKIVRVQRQQQMRDNYWDAELKKVEKLLSAAYNINIIPMQYRHNVAAIQYIYDYMSTSQVSLEHVLLATKMEEGVRRIEAKLDLIIEQQEEIMFQLHRQEAQNQKAMEQNNQIINTLQRTERNTSEAAKYARLSASYNETCAYFSIASYLNSSR